MTYSIFFKFHFQGIRVWSKKLGVFFSVSWKIVHERAQFSYVLKFIYIKVKHCMIFIKETGSKTWTFFWLKLFVFILKILFSIISILCVIILDKIDRSNEGYDTCYIVLDIPTTKLVETMANQNHFFLFFFEKRCSIWIINVTI